MEFFKLGENDGKSIMHFLYYIGFPVIFYKAIEFGKSIRMQGIVGKLQNMQLNNFGFGNTQQINIFKGSALGNIKAVIFGIIYFIIICIIWKFICELLLIIIRYFESNTNKEE